MDTALAVTPETISLDATQEKMSLGKLRNAVKKVQEKTIRRRIRRMNKCSVSVCVERDAVELSVTAVLLGGLPLMTWDVVIRA